jgi:hypothetical protein
LAAPTNRGVRECSGPVIIATHWNNLLLDGGKKIFHCDLRSGYRQDITAPGAPGALYEIRPAHLDEKLLKVMLANILPVSDLRQRDRMRLRMPRQINHGDNGIAAFRRYLHHLSVSS